MVRNQLDTVIEGFEKSPSKLSCFILACCVWDDAVDCAEAYLKGETGLPLDWNESRCYPLHSAASSLSLRLTKLLIKFGMRTNVKAAATKTGIIGGILPFHRAADSIRRRIYWTPEESIFELIVDLTGEGLVRAFLSR